MGLEDLDEVEREKRRRQRREERRRRRREFRRRIMERLALLAGIFTRGFFGLPGQILIVLALAALGGYFIWKAGWFGG